VGFDVIGLEEGAAVGQTQAVFAARAQELVEMSIFHVHGLLRATDSCWSGNSTNAPFISLPGRGNPNFAIAREQA
jgi:hypothetical protein